MWEFNYEAPCDFTPKERLEEWENMGLSRSVSHGVGIWFGIIPGVDMRLLYLYLVLSPM
jgi:hypothetical protein